MTQPPGRAATEPRSTFAVHLCRHRRIGCPTADPSARQPAQSAPFSEINYPPVASVVLGFRRADVDHPLDGFGMLIPEVEGFNILGTLFRRRSFRTALPPARHADQLYWRRARSRTGPAQAATNWSISPCDDLRVLLGVSGKPTFEHCFLFPKAIPQYEVGYGRFKELMNAIESQSSRLVPGRQLSRWHFPRRFHRRPAAISADRVCHFHPPARPALNRISPHE